MQVIDSKEPSTITHDTAPVLCDAPAAQPKKLQQLVADAIAVRHYSKRTNEAYWHWIKRFVLWSGKRHPKDMGQAEVGEFLTWLASDQQVSASTASARGASPRSMSASTWRAHASAWALVPNV